MNINHNNDSIVLFVLSIFVLFFEVSCIESTGKRSLLASHRIKLIPVFRQGTVCRTPYNYLGYCVPLLRCASLIKMLEKSNRNENHRAYLRSSRCVPFESLSISLQYDKTNVFVCCPAFDMETLSAYDGCDADNVNRVHRDPAFIDQYPWTARLMYHNGD